METVELYDNLKKAYTEENLGLISGRIIDLFRDHKYDALRAFQKVVNEYIPIQEEKINKVFSRLIMIYHPDRLSQSLGQLEDDLAEEFGWDDTADGYSYFTAEEEVNDEYEEESDYAGRSFLSVLKRRVYGNLLVVVKQCLMNIFRLVGN